MNKIKAILHNRVLYQLVNEVRPKYDYIIVDEFAREARYYDYIKDQKVIQRDITFMTKAEDKNMAVACGSIISRYIFLKEFDKLCDSIHIPLPKGAGKDVDSIGEEVVEKYDMLKVKGGSLPQEFIELLGVKSVDTKNLFISFPFIFTVSNNFFACSTKI